MRNRTERLLSMATNKTQMFNADRHNEALKEAKKDVEDILLICLYSASISAMLLQRM